MEFYSSLSAGVKTKRMTQAKPTERAIAIIAPSLDFFAAPASKGDSGSVNAGVKRRLPAGGHGKEGRRVRAASAVSVVADDEQEEEEDGAPLVFSNDRAPVGGTAPSASRRRPADTGDALAEEAVRALRNRLGVKVTGAGAVPDLMQTFEGLPTSLSPADAASLAIERGLVPAGCEGEPLQAAIASVQARHKAVRGNVLSILDESAYPEPTAIQMQAVPACLGGRDVIGIAPTGSGKTAAYALPLVLRLQGASRLAAGDGTWPGPRALILVPTKDLARQVAREVARLGGAPAGLKVTALTRAIAEGAAHETVSAALVAPELAGSKRRDEGRKGGKRAAKEEEEKEEGEGGDLLHWSDDEEPEGSPAASTAPPALWASPALPHADILVSTPLLLVAALRTARARVAAAAGVPLSSVGGIFPRLAATVLDEGDRLLGGEDWVQREKGGAGAGAGAPSSGFASQVDEILGAARPGRAALAAWWTAHGSPSPALPRAPSSSSLASHLSAHSTLSLFTATLAGEVRAIAIAALRDPLLIAVGVQGGAAPNVKQSLLFVGREDGKLVALRELLAGGVATPALAFTGTQERAEEVAAVLRMAGQAVVVLHGGVADGAREAAVKAFRRGEARWLVATDVAGRGLDYPAVRYVLNVDFPPGPAAYVHRVGRTGRGGRPGEALTLFTEDDVPALRPIAAVLAATGCDVPAWMLSLRKQGRRDKVAWVRASGDRHPLSKPSRAPGKGRR